LFLYWLLIHNHPLQIHTIAFLLYTILL